jgi:1D-myo-inositol 3-kinase
VQISPSADAVPEFLAIGHATRDLLRDGSWRLGGTVTFAALTASRLGLSTAILTSGPPDVLAALRSLLPATGVVAVPSDEATTFENIYEGGSRRQYLRGRAGPLACADVPPVWRAAALVLLAPLAGEVDPALASAFPGSLVAATPQGWLRRWDATGAVTPGPLDAAEAVLPHVHALILSREDLMARASTAPAVIAPGVPRDAAEADAVLARWAQSVPLVVATQGAAGAALFRAEGSRQVFPGERIREVDPTGAGDVFAAAFLCELRATGDPAGAIRFANRVAGISVEHEGASGIPTREQVTARFGPA